MNLKKVIAAVAAAAMSAAMIAIPASAVDATAGEAGEVAICFASGDWGVQYWLDGADHAPVEATNAVITGDGSYTVSVKCPDGASDLAFAALEVKDGETLFPGMVMTIDSVTFDGNKAILAGTPYTSSDDEVTTRVNLYNSWVGSLPDDARTVGGLASDATATPVDGACGTWTEMTVTFTVSGASSAPAEEATTEEAAEEATAEEAPAAEAPAAEDAPAADAETTSTATGNTAAAVMVSVMALAGAAAIAFRKSK